MVEEVKGDIEMTLSDALSRDSPKIKRDVISESKIQPKSTKKCEGLPKDKMFEKSRNLVDINQSNSSKNSQIISTIQTSKIETSRIISILMKSLT